MKKKISHNPTGNNRYNSRWSIRHNWLVCIVSETLRFAVGTLDSNRSGALLYKDRPDIVKAMQADPCVHVWSEPSVSGRPLYYVNVDELFLQVVGYDPDNYKDFWSDYEGLDTSNDGQIVCRAVRMDSLYILNPVKQINKKNSKHEQVKIR